MIQIKYHDGSRVDHEKLIRERNHAIHHNKVISSYLAEWYINEVRKFQAINNLH